MWIITCKDLRTVVKVSSKLSLSTESSWLMTSRMSCHVLFFLVRTRQLQTCLLWCGINCSIKQFIWKMCQLMACKWYRSLQLPKAKLFIIIIMFHSVFTMRYTDRISMKMYESTQGAKRLCKRTISRKKGFNGIMCSCTCLCKLCMKLIK